MLVKLVALRLPLLAVHRIIIVSVIDNNQLQLCIVINNN